MKVGILGGTFNPIHNSHLYLAEKYNTALALDQVLLIPTYQPPHKQVTDLASAEDRLAMCRLAAEDRPWLSVCDYEVKKEGTSYTYQTLEYLAGTRPADSFYLLMGADMFLTFLDWREPERIAQLAVLCTAPREEGERKMLLQQQQRLEEQGMKSVVLDVIPRPLSSTEIRETIQGGGFPKDSLPPRVWNYIQQHHLYR